LRFQEAKNDAEQVRFWHRLFREHLAATRIAQLDSKAGDKIEDLWTTGRLCDPFWEDVIRLLPRALGTIEKANSVRLALEKLAIKDGDHRGRLYGLAMAGIIENRDLFPDVVFSEMSARMLTLYSAEGMSWPLKDRAMFLEGLGRLDPRGGDPRFPSEQWIEIPLATRGTQSLNPSSQGPRTRPSRAEAIDLRSWMGKFPVTVQEFKAFLYSEEFTEPDLWEQMPPIALKARDSIRVRVRPQLSHPNWPVVNVGVGEAIAYCRWRTRQREDGLSLRLPLSSEWVSLDRAAGRAGWLPRVEKTEDGDPRANTFEAKYLRPTPVGAFPSQLSGIVDAVGNVWEWCVLTHTSAKDPELRGRRSFGVFGGAFNVPETRPGELFTRAPAELEYHGEPSIGFRCVLANLPMDFPSVLFSRATTDEENADGVGT
jgi:formylglycine-generating enzyme required for sulfatase activity